MNTKARVGIATFMVAACLMACSMINGEAYAQAETSGFTDVSAGEWFYEPVMTLADEGIVNGYADGSFMPQNSVTNSEALKMIFVAADIATSPAGEWEKWDANIIAEAAARGIIDRNDFQPEAHATREEIADYTVKAMNWDNASYESGIFEDADQKNVNILYAKDIVIGSEGDEGYYYYPASNITRAELSTIIVRLDTAQKERMGDITFQVKNPIKAPETFLKDTPHTKADFIKVFANMCSKNVYAHTFIYSADNNLASSEAERNRMMDVIRDAYNAAHAKYPEIVCYSDTLQISQLVRGSTYFLTLKLGSDNFSIEEQTRMKQTFMADCEQIMNYLISSGQIDGTMSETEMAKALYRYVVTDLSYDLKLNQQSYLGYGATKNHTAVCQGYTSLYNTLCKMSGIITEGITGTATNNGETENHIWSLVTLDGKRAHVDTTYGDPVPDVADRCDYSFFDVTSAYMRKNHTWDSSQFNI